MIHTIVETLELQSRHIEQKKICCTDAQITIFLRDSVNVISKDSRVLIVYRIVGLSLCTKYNWTEYRVLQYSRNSQTILELCRGFHGIFTIYWLNGQIGTVGDSCGNRSGQITAEITAVCICSLWYVIIGETESYNICFYCDSFFLHEINCEKKKKIMFVFGL